MPKEIQSIKAFQGGYNTYADARDIGEDEANMMYNINCRLTGRLVLHGILTGYMLADIPNDIGASSGPVTLSDGETFFVFHTDRNHSGNLADTTWIVYLDRSQSQLLMCAAPGDSGWHTFDGENDGDPNYGIDSKINIATNASAMQESAAYYSVDGAVRIANTQFGLPSYIGGVSSEDGTDVSSEKGASSLWVGYIDRKFTSDIVAGGWHTLPAVIQSPNATTFHKGSSNILKTAAAIGPEVQAGQFGLGVTIERNKGDGTLKLQGRKIYATYTFDGAQETLPIEIGTISLNDLPDAPTNNSLGYETTLMRAADYGASTLFLYDSVHDHDDGTKKNWENAGTITCEDNTGQTQTLQFTTCGEHAKSDITSVTRSGAVLTLVTASSLAIEGTTDRVTIEGMDTADYNGTRNIASFNNATKTYTFAVTDSGATASDNTGTARIGGTKLAGVVGWVDSGYCSRNYTIDEVILTDGGDNYTGNPDVTVSGGSPTTNAELSANIASNDYVTSMAIDNYGDGFEAVPTISFSGGGGSGATAICTITGKLSTESLCTNKGGQWTASDLNRTAQVTFDPPGEIEERDENLGIRFNLTYKPKNYVDGSDWGKTILDYKYGGPRVTHVNFYSNKYEDDAGTIPETEDFAHMCSFDLQNGFAIDPETWREWATDVTTNQTDQKVVYSDFIGSITPENYQMRTAKYPDTRSIDCRWKTAVVINRRIYAGNVYMKDSAGNEQSYPDRIIKSLPNQFDIFPDYDTLDAAVDDGDEIIHLDTFGGKLLQFKKNTLYVIDVTQEPEYVAGTFRFRGIPHKSSVARSDDGVCFANKHGVFMFIGEGIQNLVRGKFDGMWDSFYDEDNPPIVTFLPNEQVVMIAKGGNDLMLYYSIINKSWSVIEGGRSTDNDKSSWLNIDGDIVMAVGVTGPTGDTGEIDFKYWDDDYPTSQTYFSTDTVAWYSKEFDFGDPAVDSVIFNVKMSYKTVDSTSVPLNMIIAYNDGTGVTLDTCVAQGSFVGTNNHWKVIEFKPSGTNNRVNCKTAQIRIVSTGASNLNQGFEINDITIVYRNKRIK